MFQLKTPYQTTIFIKNRHTHLTSKNDVYCGRGSPLGNPFSKNSREQNISDFRLYFRNKIQEKDIKILTFLKEIDDKAKVQDVNMVCSCSPKHCHCEVVLENFFIPYYKIKPKRLIIAGSRTFKATESQKKDLINYIQDNNVFEIVSGGAKGADLFGEEIAHELNLSLKRFIPNWALGKRAGMLRNESMGKYSNEAYIFWNGSSKGTLHMIKFMKSLKKEVKVVNF